MKTFPDNLQSLLLLFAIAGFSLIANGCSTQAASTAGETNTVPAISASNPEVAGALKVIEKMPDDAQGYKLLTVAYIKEARSTGDFSLNDKAETAIKKALEIAPNDMMARKLHGSLQLTFHRFKDALTIGTQLQKDLPNDAFVYGILTDANVELGDYEAAAEAVQKMVDIRPNSTSYARVAHIRSLMGDHDGSVEMFKMAARTTDPQDKEAQSWCLVQLGDEYLKIGKYPAAEQVYDEALAVFPDFHLAIAGKGKARAAQNDLDGAEKILQLSQARVPNVEIAKLLGDIFSKKGDAERAKNEYDLVEMMETKLGPNGDQKLLALVWADRNIRLDEAREIAERQLALSSDIYTADIAAWCLYKAGRFTEAKAAIAKAMRTNSGDARILYHAGMIEKELGNRANAVRLLSKALKINPEFDLIQSAVAREALSDLQRKG